MRAENAAAIAGLCRRLDGIPLAIELAAARAGLMSPDQMLDRLRDRFGLLTGGSRTGPARHRTLQSALEWSYDLLSEEERRLFRSLSVFAGSFSLEAAEEICAADKLEAAAIQRLLGSLVDKSLLIAGGETREPIRFRMLETVQQYGHERLDKREMEHLSRHHSRFYSSLAETAAPNLIGREEKAWHRRLAHDISNVRSALTWSGGREPEANLRLNNALTYFWPLHGLIQEGDGWFTGALSGYTIRDELRAQALALAGEISYWRGDIGNASARWYECLDIYRELVDVKGIGEALVWVGHLAEWQGDLGKARMYYDDGLAMSREAKHSRAVEWTIRNLGRLALKEGDRGKARACLEESLALSEHLGNERPILANLGYLGLNAIESGDLATAGTYLEKALMGARDLDFTMGVATNLMYFAALAAARSDALRAGRLGGAAESLAESAGAAPVNLTKPVVGRWLDQSRRTIGSALWATCWAEGRAMSGDRAIEYALKV
jgi:non-specific serine/threonine protein kinase